MINSRSQRHVRSFSSGPVVHRLVSGQPVTSTQALHLVRLGEAGPVTLLKPKQSKVSHGRFSVSSPKHRPKAGSSAAKESSSFRPDHKVHTLKKSRTNLKKRQKPDEAPTKLRETSPKVKLLILQTLSKAQAQKVAAEKKEEELRKAKEEHLEYVKHVNSNIRKRNARPTSKKKERLHKSAWGVDQRPHDCPGSQKELKLLQAKKRKERKRALKEGRARIGLAHFKVKPQSKLRDRPTEEKDKRARISNPDIVQYMKTKRRHQKVSLITEQLEELLKASLRDKALLQLEQHQFTVGKRPKRKQHSLDASFKENRRAAELSRLQGIVNLQRASEWHSPLSSGNRDFEDELEDESELQEDEIVPSGPSDLVDQFRRILQERHQAIDLKFHQNRENIQSQLRDLGSAEELSSKVPDTTSPPFLEEWHFSSRSDSGSYKDKESAGVSSDSLDLSDEYSHAETDPFEAELPLFCKSAPAAEASDTSEPVVLAESRPGVLAMPLKAAPRVIGKLQIPPKRSAPQAGPTIDDATLVTVIQQELNTFLEMVSFHQQTGVIDKSPHFLESALTVLSNYLISNSEAFLEQVNSPVYYDPLEKLLILQNTDVGELLKAPTFQEVLPEEASQFLKQTLNPKQQAARAHYLRMILDCANESLNYIQPYGLKGIPPPWSLADPKMLEESSVPSLLERIAQPLRRWDAVRAGPFPTFTEEGVNELLLQKQREERLGVLLNDDVRQTEPQWLDYEDEELQVMLDVSDMIMELLVEDAASLA